MLNAQSWRLIIVWLEVRVLPGPPRSPAQTEISQFNANRPQFGGDLCTHFISAICRLDCRDRFEVFVSALENCVSRRRELALVETRFECWVSATESQASHAALTIRVLVVLGTAPPLRRCGIRPAGLICLRAGRARPRPFVSKPPAPTMAGATQSRLFRPPLIFKCSC